MAEAMARAAGEAARAGEAGGRAAREGGGSWGGKCRGGEGERSTHTHLGALGLVSAREG